MKVHPKSDPIWLIWIQWLTPDPNLLGLGNICFAWLNSTLREFNNIPFKVQHMQVYALAFFPNYYSAKIFFFQSKLGDFIKLNGYYCISHCLVVIDMFSFSRIFVCRSASGVSHWIQFNQIKKVWMTAAIIRLAWFGSGKSYHPITMNLSLLRTVLTAMWVRETYKGYYSHSPKSHLDRLFW